MSGEGDRIEEDVESVDFEDGGDEFGSERRVGEVEGRGEAPDCLSLDSDDDDKSDGDFDPMPYIAIEMEEEEVGDCTDDPIRDGAGKKTR